MLTPSSSWSELRYIINQSFPKQFTLKDILQSPLSQQFFPFLVLLLVPLILLNFVRIIMPMFSWLFNHYESSVPTQSKRWPQTREAETLADQDETQIVSRHLNGYYPGIINISGTYCFMNSVLQALSSLTYLHPYLDLVQIRAVNLDVSTPLIDSLKDFIHQLNSPSSFMQRPLHPSTIIDGIGHSDATRKWSKALLGSRDHQDAQELFQLLSEGIKGETSTVRKEDSHPTGVLAALPSHNQQTSTAYRATSSSRLLDEALPLASPFEGLTATRRSCIVCGYADAVIHSPFDNWQLPLPTMSSATTIEAILGDFMRLEVLRDCTCRKCSLTLTLAKLKSQIAELQAESAVQSSKNNTPEKPEAAKGGTTTLPNGTPVNLFDNKFTNLHSEQDPAKDPNSKKKRKKRRSPTKMLAPLKVAYERLNKALEQNRLEDEFPDVPIEKVVSRISTRQTVLARAPQILSLHMNRSIYTAYGASRNPIGVYFPEVLDMSDFVSLSGAQPLEMRGDVGMCIAGDTPPGLPRGAHSHANVVPTEERTIYRLAAVICHYGAHSFGHYVCYRRKPNGLGNPPKIVGVVMGNKEVDEMGKSGPRLVWEDDSDKVTGSSGRGWLRASDATVREIGLKDVLMEAAASCFLVFYEKASWSISGTPLSHGATEPTIKAPQKYEVNDLKETNVKVESPRRSLLHAHGRIVRNAGLSHRQSLQSPKIQAKTEDVPSPSSFPAREHQEISALLHSPPSEDPPPATRNDPSLATHAPSDDLNVEPIPTSHSTDHVSDEKCEDEKSREDPVVQPEEPSDVSKKKPKKKKGKRTT